MKTLVTTRPDTRPLGLVDNKMVRLLFTWQTKTTTLARVQLLTDHPITGTDVVVPAGTQVTCHFSSFTPLSHVLSPPEEAA